MYPGSLTDIKGIELGHAQGQSTGCTVIVPPKGNACGVDVRGGGPGTRETDLLRPVNMVEEVTALVLAGGSAYGLAAASGVMKALEEDGLGLDVGVGLVPIVPAAVIFDLAYGDPGERPQEAMGIEAYKNRSTGPVLQGSVGAGKGATVGKILGSASAMKGGIGSASLQKGDLQVAALVCVNALGDIFDGERGLQIAGPQKEGQMESTLDHLHILQSPQEAFANTNTTIGLVATNARFNKTQLTKLASMAHNGYARSIRPVHTMMDGDTIFALSCGDQKADLTYLGALAAQVMSRAIANAIYASNQ
ncbi:MAG: P1 family peptidase [Tissierellia bacterium]|nr:P1 family peptidase [Tissierellia bacterium]